MSLAETLLKDLEAEHDATRKVLERIPDDKFDWSPHEKSMNFRQLASHVADIPRWVSVTIDEDELVMNPEDPPLEGCANGKVLVDTFDANFESARATFKNANASDDRLLTHWQMKVGDMVVIDSPRVDVLRTWVVNHLIHHRAQLALYLRLNDIPVPGMYGPSADEQPM